MPVSLVIFLAEANNITILGHRLDGKTQAL
jgi:hypothetical protein